MRVFNFLEPKKHQQVIKAVRAYFNEETSTIPYSTKQIDKTIEWLNKHESPDNRLLAEKLSMAAKITAARAHA